MTTIMNVWILTFVLSASPTDVHRLEFEFATEARCIDALIILKYAKHSERYINFRCIERKP